MQRFVSALLAILLIAGGAAAADWFTLDAAYAPGSPPVVRTLSSTGGSTVLEVIVPGFWVEQTPFGTTFRIPDGLVSMDEGRPELPFVTCAVALPAVGEPKLSVRSAQRVRLPDYRVRMAPRPELEGEMHYPPPPIAPGTPCPTAAAATAHHGLWRAVPTASLQIHPFRARGDGVVLDAAARIVVEVKNPGGLTTWPAVEIDPEMRRVAAATLVNYRLLPVIDPAPPVIEATPTEYLVVAPTGLASAVQPLVDWRKRQGYSTKLIQITTTSATAIKTLIDAEFKLGKLKFVVLVGDYAQIPYYSFSGTYSDMWYACLTSSGSSVDLYPDVGLGRLSGTSTSVIAHQVAKILKYEQNPPAGNWYSQTILAAHRELAPGKYVGCCEQIAAGALGKSGWTIHKQYGHLSQTSNGAVSSLIDQGVGIVNYRGHGGTTSWVSGWCTSGGSYNTSNVNALKNGDKTPIVFNIACYNGNFKSACLNEAWLQASDAGVASLGAILPSYTTANHEYDKTLYSAIFGDKLTNIYAFYYKATNKIIGLGSAGQRNAKMYWWGGDACTSVWSKAPDTLTVCHPAVCPTGAQTLCVHVAAGGKPVSGAKVCLLKGAEVFATGLTDVNGAVFITADPATVGTLQLTVTATDCKPYLADVPVSAQAARLTITGSGNLGTKVGLGLAAPADGGLDYQIGSAFTMGPILLDQRTLGLGLDSLLILAVTGQMPTTFTGYYGKLGAGGTASASLVVPMMPGLVGFDIHSAFLTLDTKSPSGVRSISPTETFRVKS